ncbi:MAG: uncharacterized protein JWQ01_4974 [Massilia sp.]|nr:uncharacterized protein [Massilia sp.]
MARFSFLLVLTFAGCWTPTPPDGAFACNPTGKACPDGYSCFDGACWRIGHQPPDLASDVGGDDMLPATEDLAPPKKPDGEKCSGADVCASGFCIDGICCDTGCNGQCQACDTQNVGKCSPVTGPPHGSRSACTGTGTLCGGACDGTNPSACAYPSNSTICGAACDGTCSGTGTCSTTGGSCPNGFACGTSGCRTMCANNNECQTNFTCNAPNCVRIPETDCLDGLDNNGDGLADCADPTCTAQVECVPGAPAGDELGLLSSGACSSNYGTTEVQHQQLSGISCSGCGCNTSGTYCTFTAALYTNSTCTGSPSASVPATTDSTCRTFTTRAYSAMYMQATPTAACVATGSPTPGTPSWGTTTNFCAASRTSATCDASHVCVAKPATGTVCVRVPQAGASCPAGYTNGQSYYSSFQSGTCNTCGCTPGSTTCSVNYIDLYNSNSCVQGSLVSSWEPMFSTCQTQHCYTDIFGTYKCDNLNMWSLGAISITGGATSTCSASASVATQPAPNGGSTICCMP